MKYTNLSTCEGSKIILIDIEYKIQHPIQVCWALIIHTYHCRCPANKHVHETHPLHDTTTKL